MTVHLQSLGNLIQTQSSPCSIKIIYSVHPEAAGVDTACVRICMPQHCASSQGPAVHPFTNHAAAAVQVCAPQVGVIVDVLVLVFARCTIVMTSSVFKIHRVQEDDVDDFNNVMGWRNLIELVRNATTPQMAALFPSQDGKSVRRSIKVPKISRGDEIWTYEQNGKRLIFAGVHLFDDLAEFVLDKDGMCQHSAAGSAICHCFPPVERGQRTQPAI